MGNGTPLPVVLLHTQPPRASEYACPCHPSKSFVVQSLLTDFIRDSSEIIPYAALVLNGNRRIRLARRAAFCRGIHAGRIAFVIQASAPIGGNSFFGSSAAGFAGFG